MLYFPEDASPQRVTAPLQTPESEQSLQPAKSSTARELGPGVAISATGMLRSPPLSLAQSFNASSCSSGSFERYSQV